MDGLAKLGKNKSKGFDDYKSNGLKSQRFIIPFMQIAKEILPTGMVTLFLKEIKAKLVESG
jgi:hypothetical protein